MEGEECGILSGRTWSKREIFGTGSLPSWRSSSSTPFSSSSIGPTYSSASPPPPAAIPGPITIRRSTSSRSCCPHFKLTGWAPGWYAGMPMLTFYFPFPFLLIAILNWILPYQLAFKLVTVLGVFALPATAYAMGRLWRVRRPFPMLAAVFALAMLFMESYSIYGGNVKSTLAGEFGYMLSFALVFLFLGTMYRGMEKPHFNMLFVLNCLILMALVLSHIVPTIALVFISPGLLLVNPRWRSFGYLAVVALVGFALVAFWSLPFAANLEWTAHMAWNQLGWNDFLPAALYPVAALAIIGVAFAVAKRESKLLPLVWISFISAVVYWILPDGRLWNARIVPFWYFSLHLWAAYGAMWMIRPFTVVVHDLFRWRGITARRVYVPLVAVVIGVAVIAHQQHRCRLDQVELLRVRGQAQVAPVPADQQLHRHTSARPGDGGAQSEDRRVRYAARLRDNPLLDGAAHDGGHPHGGLLHRSLPLHQPGGAVQRGQ